MPDLKYTDLPTIDIHMFHSAASVFGCVKTAQRGINSFFTVIAENYVSTFC